MRGVAVEKPPSLLVLSVLSLSVSRLFVFSHHVARGTCGCGCVGCVGVWVCGGKRHEHEAQQQKQKSQGQGERLSARYMRLYRGSFLHQNQEPRTFNSIFHSFSNTPFFFS